MRLDYIVGGGRRSPSVGPLPPLITARRNKTARVVLGKPNARFENAVLREPNTKMARWFGGRKRATAKEQLTPTEVPAAVLLLAAMRNAGYPNQEASPNTKLQGGRTIFLAAMQRHAWSLEHAPRELREDREVVMAAVRRNGHALKYASADLRADREVVMAAVTQGGHALQYASAGLRADREFVMAAVKKGRDSSHALTLKYASAELQADREIVLAAVSHHADSLEHASANLRASREVAMAAVAKDGNAVKYATDACRADCCREWSSQRP